MFQYTLLVRHGPRLAEGPPTPRIPSLTTGQLSQSRRLSGTFEDLPRRWPPDEPPPYEGAAAVEVSLGIA